MTTAPILCLGSQWRASDVYCSVIPKNAVMHGVDAGNIAGPEVNFAKKSGIYALHANCKPVYVG